MLVRRLWLTGFRNYDSLTVELGPGLTAVLGDNGQGKTNLVEAMAFLARLDSFRGTPTDALVRHGDEAAVVRAEVVHADGRELLVEAEIGAGGRTRVLVNRQRLVRSRDLLGVLRVTVFSPDDLALVKGAPGERRRFLDDVLVALQPAHDRLRREVERVLKQRTTLLKQAGGRLSPEVELTLDVWDARLVESGEALGRHRADLVADLEPLVAKAYEQLAGGPADIRLSYDPAWRRTGLAEALATARDTDLRRAVTSVGPHRDDVDLSLGGLPARTHASQGEQRALALALRLAAHQVVAERIDESPLLLLDDVLSELDPDRAAALLRHVPEGQVVLTSAGPLPDEARPGTVLRIAAGTLIESATAP